MAHFTNHGIMRTGIFSILLSWCIADLTSGQIRDHEQMTNNGEQVIAEHNSRDDIQAIQGASDKNDSIYQKSVPDSGAAESQHNLDIKAYPNPFTESALVTFTVEVSGRTTLRLIDHSGRQLGAIFDETVERNRKHEVRISGDLLTAGLYYIILRQSDGIIKILKIIYKH